MERAVERPRQRVRESGFADAGDILDQQVAARKQRHQGQLDDFVLAADDALNGPLEPGHQLRRRGGVVPDLGVLHRWSWEAVDFLPRSCYFSNGGG